MEAKDGKRVAVIGLGTMGAPMARNLVAGGFDVVGYNRSKPAIERLEAAGGFGSPDVASAVRGADYVLTILPDTPDVESVLLSEKGVFASADTGCLVIDCSTIKPGSWIALEAAGREAGLRLLDAPVSGGERGAIEATLSIMVGGDKAVFDAATPLLNVIGRTVVHVGPPGAGQTVKAANQLIVAGNIQLVAEALVFLEAQGVDAMAALEVMSGGLAGSTVMERKARSMLNRDFSPGFRMELHDKDLGIFLDSARSVGVAFPLGAIVSQLVRSAKVRGDGKLDHSALFKLANELSGRA